MSSKIFFILSIIFMILATRGFGYVNFGDNWPIVIFYFIFGYYVFRHRKFIGRQRLNFNRQAKGMILIPFLCLITMTIEGTNNLVGHPKVVVAYLFSTTFLLYYFLHGIQLREKDLLKVLIGVALIVFIIQVYQQFNYDKAVFGIWSENTMAEIGSDLKVEIRNGILRYRIPATCFTLFAIFYYWDRFLHQRRLKYFLLFAIFCVSIYLTLTRQLIAITLIGIALLPIFSNRTSLPKKIGYMILTIGVLAVIYNYSDVLFGDLIEKTQEQSGEDNIRNYSFAYYFDATTKNWYKCLLGSGHQSPEIAYGAQFNFWPDDVGFMGEWHFFGLLWLILYVYILYSILIKNYRRVPNYIKIFVFVTFLDCFMIFPYRNSYEFYLWASILYICDLHINNSPLALNYERKRH